MATKKKLLQAAAGSAGSAGGAGLDITDVFSTYLYEGTGSALTINNGIDLAGEGGMVWWKSRSTAESNMIIDSERTAANWLSPNTTGAQFAVSGSNLAFNSTGYSQNNSYSESNASGVDFASWTFRKAPKFFDVVTYTGNGTANRAISHNLGSSPGMVIIKRTSASENWVIWHRSLASNKMLTFTSYATTSSTPTYDSSLMTSTTFGVNTDNSSNANGSTYVAYLYAHNNGDGEFGPDSDQDIIKCGSYTGNGGTQDINLGFEPQWIMIKGATTNTSWHVFDVMRGWDIGSSFTLQPNTNQQEFNYETEYTGAKFGHPTATGFKLTSGTSHSNQSSQTYIYMAIRRGPLAVPEDATEVFAVDVDGGTNNHYTSGFPVDLGVYKSKLNTYNWSFNDRLRGALSLKSNSTAAENGNAVAVFDNNTGWADSAGLTSEYPSWMWKRAPNFFEVVAYTGNSTAGRTVSHNLGVAPEMMWVKKRNSSSNSNWKVYHVANGNNYHMFLNLTSKGATSAGSWNNTTPTDSVFTLGNAQDVNNSGDSYIAYLFASLDGVSKCGGYTGNGAGEYVTGGSSQTIDCGFTSGARFVLIKSTSIASNDWQLWDSARGIVAGNDPHLSLNTTAAEVTSDDSVDAHSSGFTVNQAAATNVNASGETYIFYAIA